MPVIKIGPFSTIVPDQAIPTFIKSLHALVLQLFLSRMKLQLAPSSPNVERNVERKIDIEARGIRTRQKSGLRICKNESSHCAHVQWRMSTHLRGTCRGIMWPW